MPLEPPPPVGAAQAPSSRRKCVLPAVVPGSGTMPDACVLPDAPNTGRCAAAMVPEVMFAALSAPLILVAFNVPALIVPAVNAPGVKLYDVPRIVIDHELAVGEYVTPSVPVFESSSKRLYPEFHFPHPRKLQWMPKTACSPAARFIVRRQIPVASYAASGNPCVPP